jgi:hypothetical protein
MAHLLGPILSNAPGAKNRVGQLLKVLTSMIKIDNLYPLQYPPGTARIDHLFENAVVVGTGVMAFIADIDQASAVAIDSSEGVIGAPTAHTLGQGRCGQTRFKVQMQL